MTDVERLKHKQRIIKERLKEAQAREVEDSLRKSLATLQIEHYSKAESRKLP